MPRPIGTTHLPGCTSSVLSESGSGHVGETSRLPAGDSAVGHALILSRGTLLPRWAWCAWVEGTASTFEGNGCGHRGKRCVRLASVWPTVEGSVALVVGRAAPDGGEHWFRRGRRVPGSRARRPTLEGNSSYRSRMRCLQPEALSPPVEAALPSSTYVLLPMERRIASALGIARLGRGHDCKRWRKTALTSLDEVLQLEAVLAPGGNSPPRRRTCCLRAKGALLPPRHGVLPTTRIGRIGV
jgi:hypothetical protein